MQPAKSLAYSYRVKDAQGRRALKRAALITQVAILFVLLVFMARLSTPVAAQGPTGTPTVAPAGGPTPSTSNDEIMALIQRTSDDASKAVDSANTILGLIQSFGTLLEILFLVIGVLGSIIGIRTLSDFNATRQRFETEINQATEKLHEFEKRVEEDTEKVRQQGNRAMRALTLLQLGKQQMDARNRDAALSTLLQAYEYDPENRATNYFMGELYIQLGQLDEGVEHLKKAGAEITDVHDEFPAAKAAYAYALRRKGDQAKTPNERRQYYHAAEGYFWDALNRNPKLLDIEGESFYGALGGLYQRQDRLKEAIECYERALEATQRTSSYPYNNLGILYTIQGDPDKAKLNFETAVRIAGQRLDDKPQDYWPRFDMVTAQIMLGNAVEVSKHMPMVRQSAASAEQLEKFQSSLKRLRETAPSEMLNQVIELLQKEIERRQKQEARA
jgi:tetratricopeptide (TPR) repeat protein